MASASRSAAAIRGVAARNGRAHARVFGLPPTLYESADRAAELKLVNRVAAAAWQAVFGFRDAESAHEAHPRPRVQRACSAAPRVPARLSSVATAQSRPDASRFATSSYDLASGLMYLLSSLGVVASLSEHEPDGQVRLIRGQPCVTRHRYWQITVTRRRGPAPLEAVWADHPARDRHPRARGTRRRRRSIVASTRSTAT